MRFGFHLTPFWNPTDREPARIFDEAVQVVAAASRLGFDWVSIGQHWLSHPTIWPQPIPFLARLAPETGGMQLKTKSSTSRRATPTTLYRRPSKSGSIWTGSRNGR